MASSHAVDTKISRTTPSEYGSGASTSVAASLSTPAWDTSSPVPWAPCHASGWAWYCPSTSSWMVAFTCHWPLAANERRNTTPIARTIPMTMTRQTPATTVAAATLPSSKRGTMTLSVTHWMANADATVATA